VFYRNRQRLGQLRELAGKRIAIGGVGNGTHILARLLLALSGVTEANAVFSTQRLDQAPADLPAGLVDVVFISGAVDALPLRALIAVPEVRLMNFAHAGGYAQLFPYMSKLTVPREGLDISRDFPDQNIDMVGTSVNLIVRDDHHPALMYLLLDTASKLHGGRG
jgi:uncharacterized protein